MGRFSRLYAINNINGPVPCQTALGLQHQPILQNWIQWDLHSKYMKKGAIMATQKQCCPSLCPTKTHWRAKHLNNLVYMACRQLAPISKMQHFKCCLLTLFLQKMRSVDLLLDECGSLFSQFYSAVLLYFPKAPFACCSFCLTPPLYHPCAWVRQSCEHWSVWLAILTEHQSND